MKNNVLDKDIIQRAECLPKGNKYDADLFRSELETGETSPMIENFNPQKHLASLHARHL